MKKSLLMWLSINIISIFLISCNAERNNPIDLEADNFDEAIALSATSIVIPEDASVNEGATATINVKLKENINISVAVNITSGNAISLTVSPSTLTFTPENWNVDQAVTLTGKYDTNSDSESITVTASADRLTAATVLVNVVDFATNSIEISNVSTLVNEGSTGSMQVKLSKEIYSDVTINIASSDAISLTVSPSTLTFTPENWNVDQAVTLTGVEDADLVWEKNATITASSAGLSDQTSIISVRDNDANGYYNNGDGTIYDGPNNLFWMKCSQGQNNDATCTGTASTFQYCTTNDNSCDDGTILTSGPAYGTCNDLNTTPSGGFAGRTTWRVPTKDELKNLVYCDNGTSTPLADYTNCGSGYTIPTIDPSMFPNTVLDSYWSSTPDGTANAWNVYFNYGIAGGDPKSDLVYVRCLSPGP